MCFMHFFISLYFVLFIFCIFLIGNEIKFSSVQARSQKFAIGGGLFWGSGGGAPSARNFAFFCKNSLILEVF